MKQDYSQYILPVGILFLAYMALKRFGIVKDTAAEQTEQKQLFSDYFSPNFLRNKRNVKLFSQDGAQYVAAEIFKSKGVFNDDENRLWAAIKNFRYKTQVSQVAGIFANTYKKDLAAYLNSFLNQNELERLYSFTNNLPTGT